MSDTPDNGMADFMAELAAYEESQKQASFAAEEAEGEPAVAGQEAQEAQPPAQPQPQPQQYAVPEELLEIQRNQMRINEQLAARLSPPVEEEKPKAYKLDAPTLTAEEEEAFAQSAPVIKKLAQQMVAEAVSRYDADVVGKLRQENETLQARLSSFEGTTTQSKNELADAQLMGMTATHIPNYKQFIHSSTWQNFLREELPGSGGITRMEIAHNHGSKGNLQAIAAMMIEAKKREGVPAERLVSPGNTGVPEAVARQKNGPKALPYSEYKKAMDMHGRGKLTNEEFSRITNAYESAGMAGNIDYNK